MVYCGGVTDCIISPLARYKVGLPYAKKGNTTHHRVVFEECHGPIPDGMYVCHTCDNPPCINIDHLFLGTPRDNMLDKVAKGRHSNGNDRKTHCKRGHEFTEENTRMEGHRRRCRQCERDRCHTCRSRDCDTHRVL